MKKINISKKRKGFTLIEIIISITILLALTVLGVVKYVNVVEENNIKIDIINAKTLADGVQMAYMAGVIDETSSKSNNSELSSYIDTTVTTKSKEYGKNEPYSYSFEGSQVIIHSSNNKQLYPYLKNEQGN